MGTIYANSRTRAVRTASGLDGLRPPVWTASGLDGLLWTASGLDGLRPVVPSGDALRAAGYRAKPGSLGDFCGG